MRSSLDKIYSLPFVVEGEILTTYRPTSPVNRGCRVYICMTQIHFDKKVSWPGSAHTLNIMHRGSLEKHWLCHLLHCAAAFLKARSTTVTLMKCKMSHPVVDLYYPTNTERPTCRVNPGPLAKTLTRHWPNYFAMCVLSEVTMANTCKHETFGQLWALVNPFTTKLFNWNFHSLEVVSRWRDSQLQVSENYSDLTKEKSIIFKSCWLM